MQSYSESLICVNKQNTTRSGTEQVTDLTKTFKIIPLLQKSMSVTNVPMDNHPMKRFIANVFKDLQSKQKINLNQNKKDALIDFISCIPEMTTRAVTREMFYIASWRMGWLVKF